MKHFVLRAAGLAIALAVSGAALAQAQPVEWKVSDGGNGHWYRAVAVSPYATWSSANSAAGLVGGHLVTITGSAEAGFVRNLIVSTPNVVRVLSGTTVGPWIGAVKNPTTLQFEWCTGEPWGYTEWAGGEPSGASWEDRICYYGGSLRWNDRPGEYTGNTATPSYVIEWSADCNGDGQIDYGQIVRGELDDDNANGIPDVCETSVSGAIPPSVPSQGGSTVTIKGANFPQSPTVLIGGVPATNVVRISATRITATSPALLPGMTSISVDNYTLPDAIYIRPECGSDLDQDGNVDTADVSIILLDFGPCVSNAATPGGPTIREHPEETARPTPARSAAP